MSGGATSDRQPQGARPPPRLEDVYRAHWTFIWRSAKKMGIPTQRLEDVVQDTFVVAGQRLAEFEGRSSIKTWLYAIAFRVVQEHHRRIEREGRGSPGGATQAEPIARVEAAIRLQQLLGELDEDKRVVFVFSELEGMSAAEIAEELGVNVNTVSSRLRLARERLQKALHRHRAQLRRAGGGTGAVGT
ncbi:MAG: sigma-70 family RNA polymerase sigma factor [Myxococcota bacterium]